MYNFVVFSFSVVFLSFFTAVLFIYYYTLTLESWLKRSLEPLNSAFHNVTLEGEREKTNLHLHVFGKLQIKVAGS